MKIFFSLLFLLIIKSSFLSAQIPSTCFVIEDILVDACLTPSSEGENEMLRLRIGQNDLNTADLIANWPNNSYNGICQDAQTASVVNQINNTITGCGYLIEPVNGVLPAGSQVLFFTSTEPEVSFHDYSNLNDTMVVIFQCVGNLAGHFANWGTGLRTTTITFTGPNGCSDTKTYDRALLTNQNGGIGGNAAIRDGAGVRYNFVTGDVIYYNEGCVVPVTPVEVEILSNDTTICPGEDIFLEGYSFNATEVLWHGGDGTFTNTDDYTTTYTSSVNEVNPFYLYFDAISACQTITDSILISPSTGIPISLNINPGNTVCTGDTITLSTNSTETHEWFMDGVLISGISGNTISITEEGSYFAQIDVSGCVQTTDTATLNFENLFSAEINNTSPGVICAGDSLTLNADPGFSEYQWFFNDNLISTTTDNFISVSEEGSYTVLVNPSSSCVDTSTAFNLITNSPIPLAILSSDTVFICQNDSTTIIAETGFSNYQWFIDGSATTFTNNEITVNQAGNYYAEATDTNGCLSISDTVSVLLIPTSGTPISLNINPGNTVCTGDTINLSTNSNEPHQWFKDGVLISGISGNTISVTEEGSYYALIDSGCVQTTDTAILNFENLLLAEIINTSPGMLCAGDSLTLNADPGFSEYQWFFNDNLISTTTDNFISVSEEGSYTVLVNPSSSCADTSSAFNLITNTPQALAIFSSDSVNICQNDSTSIVADPNFSNYQWFINGTAIGFDNNEIIVGQAGNYYVEAIDFNGCPSISDTIIVQISDTTEINLNVIQGNQDFTFCPEDTFIVELEGIWVDQEWVNQNNQVVSTSNTLEINPNQSGDFSIFTENNSGCISSLNFEVNVLSADDIDIISENGNLLCSGETTVLSIGENYQEIIWNNEINAATIEADAGNYEVSAIDENSCAVTGSIFIDIAPEIWYDLNDTLTVDCQETFTIEDFSSDAISFSWSPSEIFNDNNMMNPMINELYNGQIKVTMEDQNNCTKVAETFLSWTPCGDLFLPNAFAPDGLNNTLSVLGRTESIGTFNFKIFNRWGEIVFETSDPNIGWDGTYKGQKAPIGSYVWFIEGRFEDGRVLKINNVISGNILLMR